MFIENQDSKVDFKA